MLKSIKAMFSLAVITAVTFSSSVVSFGLEINSVEAVGGQQASGDKISSSVYTTEEGYIITQPKLTVQQFLQNVTPSGRVTVYKGTTQQTNQTTIATSMEARLYDGSNVIDTLTLAVLGDTSGSGTVSSGDALRVLQHTTKKITLTPVQQKAADVTGKDGVSSFDALNILQFSSGRITEFK